mmetsp:Transcript_76068/g.212589  ORF Transcript_76068/g.212589 Transcript_76068/m.212589 type:complete len:372 (+) Transcript_76068:115-1230(+)
MNFYTITALYAVFGGLGIGIFLWGKPDGNSMFDRLYRLICQQLPAGIKRALEKCCGKRAPAFLDWLWNYVCYTSNPIVQVFYLCVIVGGFLTFVTYGFPHLPNRLVGSVHKYTGFAVFVVCLSVWWKACSTDPGTVTPLNVDDLCKIHEWDDVIFTNMQCKTCDIVKPARSKHCGLCNVCVARFDHHCIWLNNCVGVGNHKWFLSFLFWHLVLCLYGFSLGTVLIYNVIVEKDLQNAVFVDPLTRQKHKATWSIIGQYMLASEGMIIFVSLLALVMGLVLFGFFLWHLNLVRTGMTTNELSKWNYVKWSLRQEGEQGKEELKKLVNPYNKGMIANFREVFFNIDVHRLPGRDGKKDQAQAKSRDKKKTKKS